MYFMRKETLSFKNLLMMHFGIILLTLGVYFFKTPNGFATGGVSGMSIILANMFPVTTQAIYMLVINAFLLVIGVIVLGKECGFLTIYCSLLFSVGNWVLERLVPLNGTLTDNPLLELVYAMLLTGVGSAIIFKCKGSSGGTDIVALILRKYTHMNVGTALLCTDLCIALSTFVRIHSDGIFFDAKTGLFSLLGLFAKVFIVDDIIDSMNLCKAFTIITTKPDEINNYIMNDIHHSATTYPAVGAYTHEEKTVIVTVCRRSEAIRLRRRVNEIDPHAFIIITKTSEIMGKGFRDNVN
jgi:uncharacterized membrane-anchored protein YitT (DUF2179 family)